MPDGAKIDDKSMNGYLHLLFLSEIDVMASQTYIWIVLVRELHLLFLLSAADASIEPEATALGDAIRPDAYIAVATRLLIG